MRRQVLKKLCKITRLMISDTCMIYYYYYYYYKFYLVRGPVSSTQKHLQFYHPLHQQLPPYM